MRSIALTVVLLSTILSGCAAVGETFRPDIAAKPLPSRLEEISYINTLRTAFVTIDAPSAASPKKIVGGSNIAEICFKGDGLKPFKANLSQGFRDTQYKEDYTGSDDKCITYRTDGTAAEVDAYLNAGFGLTDIYCNRFFTVASASAQTRKFGRNFASGVDVLVGSVLNLSGVGPIAVGATNAGFGLLDKTIDSYDTSFLIAPELADAQKLVFAAQDEYKINVNKITDTDLTKSGFIGARSIIERYANICSFSGMKQLVGDSIKEKTQKINKNSTIANSAAGAGAGAPPKAGLPPPVPKQSDDSSSVPAVIVPSI